MKFTPFFVSKRYLRVLHIFLFLEMLKSEGSLKKVRNCSGFIVSLQTKSVIFKMIDYEETYILIISNLANS